MHNVSQLLSPTDMQELQLTTSDIWLFPYLGAFHSILGMDNINSPAWHCQHITNTSHKNKKYVKSV